MDDGELGDDDERGVGPVVVGIDESASAREAAVWAGVLARARGARLELVHVTTTQTVPGWLTDLGTSLSASVRLVSGPGEPDTVVTRLRAESDGAGLCVVGGFGSGSDTGLLAGTVAAGLAGGTGCPLAVVRGPEVGSAPPTRGPVVVGVAGAASGVLDLAAGLARDLGTPLSVVHAWSDVVAGPAGGAHRRREEWDDLAARGRAVVEDAIALVRARDPDVDVEGCAVEGTALAALLDRADGARVLVAAPRAGAAPRPSDGMLLGSTSRGLVGFAPCPVVLAGTGAATG